MTAAAGATAGWLDVDGTRLEYGRWGRPREGTPVLVLLHQGLGCVAGWRDFPDRLATATGLEVFAYSRAGYGASDPCALPRPLDYMEREGRDILPLVLDAAAIGDCILYGHSDGGSIALVHAATAPGERLRGLILEAPHVFVEDLSVSSIAGVRAAFVDGDLRAGIAKRHGANTDCAFWGWNDAWLDPGFRHWTLEPFLPAIRVPALVIQGRGDEYGTALQVETIAARSGGPVAVTLLDDCGHFAHREQAEKLLAATTRFVASRGR